MQESAETTQTNPSQADANTTSQTDRLCTRRDARKEPSTNPNSGHQKQQRAARGQAKVSAQTADEQVTLSPARLSTILNDPSHGSTNLLNLATIDNAFFNQQQQLRAEQQQQLARPTSSPSSSTSTECLTSERTFNSASTTSASSSDSTPYLGGGGGGGGTRARNVAGQQQQQQPQHQQDQQAATDGLQAQHPRHHGNKDHLHQISQSDTTDDIQSISSQFNLCLVSNPQGQQQQALAMQSGPPQTPQPHHDQVHPQPPDRQPCVESAPFIQGHGHYFTKKTFHKPTYCHHCADMLWGLIGQGYICEVCNFVVHERCMKTVVSCCSTVASSAIKNPMPHCWTDAHPKRKFCNVCRKKIEDNANAIRCSVCEYCVHLECQEFSISDCRECATYVPDQSLRDVIQQHHWREGNLPQNGSKCYWCKKSCFSAECLTGMRCEWCQITVHASCLKHAPRECNLGSLQLIMLPPYCVSIPRTDVPMETIIGVQNRYNYSLNPSSSTGAAASASCTGLANSGSGGSMGAGGPIGPSAIAAAKRDNLSPRSTSEDFCQSALYYQQQEDLLSRDKDEEMLRVYDGNSSMKKRSFRLISVHRAASRENLIAACLRAFYIHDDIGHYALIDISDGEREIDEQYPLASLIGKRDKQLRPPAVLLRYRPPDSSMGSIKVYPGRLNVTDLTYCKVMVTSDTSVDDIMKQALDKFKLKSNDLSRYRLVEVSLDKGSSVHERTMDNQECPWEIIKNVARESVRQKENTRFYLQQQDEVYCSSVAIFVGNLPTNLSQKQYESMLMEQLGKPYRFKQINPIYYEYGSCIITYDNADIAVKAFYMLRESTIKFGDETKGLVVLLLPNIMPDLIPNGVRVSQLDPSFLLKPIQQSHT